MVQHSIDLCRSWLFVGWPDARPETAEISGADVVILELEDFTPPEARPAGPVRRRRPCSLPGGRRVPWPRSGSTPWQETGATIWRA
jgi:hypothetical protein